VKVEKIDLFNIVEIEAYAMEAMEDDFED